MTWPKTTSQCRASSQTEAAIYLTCSVEKRENEEVVQTFLENNETFREMG